MDTKDIKDSHTQTILEGQMWYVTNDVCSDTCDSSVFYLFDSKTNIYHTVCSSGHNGCYIVTFELFGFEWCKSANCNCKGPLYVEDVITPHRNHGNNYEYVLKKYNDVILLLPHKLIKKEVVCDNSNTGLGLRKRR